MVYYYDKRVEGSFDDVFVEVVRALERERFRVLARIDIQDFLQQRLDVVFRRYVIISAFCASYTCKALMVEDKIGTMLPCNLVVQEREGGSVEVAAGDPFAAVAAVDNPESRKIAYQLRQKIQSVIHSL
jgi:uncharacterized protein (DUF302 family)